MRVLLTGGGTGGHIYPALSIIKAIREKDKNTKFMYIGTAEGLEAKIVPEAGVDFKAVKITGLKRSLSLENFKTLYRFVDAMIIAKKYIKDFKPDIVIGTGGYVCAPVVYIAAKLKIKTLIHEQNALPGVTNKFLARYVDKILICSYEAHKYFPEEKVIMTGNPRATEVVKTLKLGKTALGLDPHKKTVLISGGSRGAKPINDAFISMIETYENSGFEVVFVTGTIHHQSIIEQIKEVGVFKNVKIMPFISDMPKFLVSIDLFVGRSGATFLSEITALGVPSILVPSPYVAENHQEFNARSITDHGGGVLILEKDLTGELLYEQISRLLNNEQVLESMRVATKLLGVPNASAQILNVIDDII